MVQLVPMNSQTYQAYIEQSVTNYADEKIRSGNWPAEKANELSRQAFQKLLPQGLETPKQHLFSILEDQSGQEVGWLWYGLLEEAGRTFAYIYDFVIFEEQRRKGYGLQALQALDEEVKRVGLQRIGLHVFGHNRAAILLYEKAGYTASNITMVRNLE